ncbi:MAG: glycosyltransferase [Elusimicrobia bacterium]|nr:glycosyltransferase [Elusimicrobiota bacterium]
MPPLVSVVIDNYNYGRFLAACLDSVLAQDYPADRLEVIVVDDGSTDDSRAVLARYAPRVKAVHQANGGQAAAFNRGIRESRGELVCLLDSDDAWAPSKVSKVAAAFEAHPEAGAVQHYLQETDAALTSVAHDLPAWPPLLTLEQYLDGSAVLSAATGLAYRRRFLDLLLPIPAELLVYSDDFLTIGTLFYAPVVNLSERLGFHRVHGGNQYAGNYADPRKLAKDARTRIVFRQRVDGWLAQHGKALSPRFARLEGLELARREILFHMHEGRRREAASAWWRGFRRHGRDGFGLFRMLTCGLALLSPALYLKAYAGYSNARGLKALRRSVLPE